MNDQLKAEKIDDGIAAGATADEIANNAVESIPTFEHDSDKRSVSALAIEIAKEHSQEFFHTPTGDAYVSVDVENHIEHWELRSSDFRSFLAKVFYEKAGRVLNSAALQDALAVLEGICHHASRTEDIHVRIAGHDGDLYYDLANPEREVVKITPDGWRVESKAPVRFKRSRGMLPQVKPVPGGDISLLRKFIRTADTDWPLVTAALVGSLAPRGPYVIVVLSGQHGSAKTTTGKFLRALIDPAVAELRSLPRELRDFSIGANNAWMMAYDNVSKIQPWQSDALCRLSTGDGYQQRKNYTDNEEMIFSYQRPALLTGIGEFVERSDLVDRIISPKLIPIQRNERIRESDLFPEFEKVRPQLMGAIFDGLSSALRNYDEVPTDSFPRMADFAAWATAAELAWNHESGTFASAYFENRSSFNDSVLENSPLAQGILEFMSGRHSWEGSAQELLDQLTPDMKREDRKKAGWPTTPRGIRSSLDRLAPNLLEAGLTIRHPDRKSSKRLVSIVSDSTVTNVTTVTPSSEPYDGRDDGYDGRTPTPLQSSLSDPVRNDRSVGYDGFVPKSVTAVREHQLDPSPSEVEAFERDYLAGQISDSGGLQ